MTKTSSLQIGKAFRDKPIQEPTLSLYDSQKPTRIEFSACCSAMCMMGCKSVESLNAFRRRKHPLNETLKTFSVLSNVT